MQNLKNIHAAIEAQQPKNYQELCDLVCPFVSKTWGWNANSVYFNGYYQGVRIGFYKGEKAKYLPSLTNVYAIYPDPKLPPINVNNEGKRIK